MAKSTASPLAPATAPTPADPLERLRQRAEEHLRHFRQGPPTPRAAYDLEKDLRAACDEAARALLEQEFNRAEPDDKAQVPPKVRYRGQTYRLNKKTKAEVATSFGPLTLRSFLYLCNE